MKNFMLSIMLVLCSISTVNAEQGRLKLQVLPAGNYLAFRLTSLVDQVTINKVTVNRGACDRWSFGDPKPGTVLKYGQSKDWKLMVYNGTNGAEYPCEILEVAVSTPEGTHTFTRNN